MIAGLVPVELIRDQTVCRLSSTLFTLFLGFIFSSCLDLSLVLYIYSSCLHPSCVSAIVPSSAYPPSVYLFPTSMLAGARASMAAWAGCLLNTKFHGFLLYVVQTSKRSHSE